MTEMRAQISGSSRPEPEEARRQEIERTFDMLGLASPAEREAKQFRSFEEWSGDEAKRQRFGVRLSNSSDVRTD